MRPLLIKHIAATALTIAMCSTQFVQAESFKYPEIKEDRPAGFTITPMVGWHNFDPDRNLDDKVFTGIGVGYRFSNPYMVEFVYSTADAQTTGGINQGDVRQMRLEMLYDTGNFGNWNPYIALGAASTEFGDNATVVDDEGAMTLGFGARYHFTDRIALRGDARYIRAVGDTNGADVSLGLGLQIFLGKTVATPVATTVDEPADEPIASPELPASSLAERCAQAGGELDAGDCVKKVVSTERVMLNVQFAPNSDQVQAAYLAEVKKLGDFMNTYPDATVVIEGHTDATGSEEYNQQLSQRRVNSIVRLLSSVHGIAINRTTPIGYGEARPIAPNDTVANRAKNRRVVASITAEIEEIISLDVQ